MRLTVRGDLLALIEAERPTVSPAEAFAALNQLAMRTTGIPLRDLVRRASPDRSAGPSTQVVHSLPFLRLRASSPLPLLISTPVKRRLQPLVYSRSSRQVLYSLERGR